MSYIATTQANDREDWREALRAAAAEIETEEVRDFLAQDDAGVTFDRRYLARRRKALARIDHRHHIHRVPWAVAAVLVLILLPTWTLTVRQATPSTEENAHETTVLQTPSSEPAARPTDSGKTIERASSGLDDVETFEVEKVNYTKNGVSAQISYTVPVDTMYICAITSDRNHVRVPGMISGQTHPNTRAILYGDTALSRAVSVTFGEGIRYLSFGVGIEETSEVSDRFPRLEVLKLPASLKDIYCTTERMQLLIMQDLTTVEPKWGESGFNFWRTVKEETGYSGLYATFPLDLAHLRLILVAEGNEYFWDEDGMLYGNNFVGLEVDESEYPKRQLICLPQNYSRAAVINGKVQVTLPEGTDYIHAGAVYHCNIDRLVIPATVTRIAPAAIVATYARPLTIVGQKGSTAEEYVRMFGDKYFLKFEEVT